MTATIAMVGELHGEESGSGKRLRIPTFPPMEGVHQTNQQHSREYLSSTAKDVSKAQHRTPQQHSRHIGGEDALKHSKPLSYMLNMDAAEDASAAQ